MSYNFTVPVPLDVRTLFETLALDLQGKGWEHYSARAILHRIRWHYHVEVGDREFKCNDHWTPDLSRWVMHEHPSMTGFFNIRKARCDP